MKPTNQWHSTPYGVKTLCVCHDPPIWMPWLTQMCAMSHWYGSKETYQLMKATDQCHSTSHGANACHDSLIYVPCLTLVCAMTHSFARPDVYHDLSSRQIEATSLHIFVTQWSSIASTDKCAMTPSYVCHDPLICVPQLTPHICCTMGAVSCLLISVRWLTQMCAMTHSTCMLHNMGCIASTDKCAMTYSHVCHDPVTCVPWLTPHVYCTLEVVSFLLCIRCRIHVSYVFIYVCMHIYVSMCTYIHIHTYTYVYTCIYIYIYTYIYTCIYIYIYICICMYM